MQPSNSIEMAIWVAVGGRSTLIGALLGAWLVNGAKSWLTAAFPSAWLYALGALFVIVTLFLPKGIVGLVAQVRGALQQRRAVKPAAVAAAPAPTPEPVVPVPGAPAPAPAAEKTA
jgi:urea transport system permease protein